MACQRQVGTRSRGGNNRPVTARRGRNRVRATQETRKMRSSSEATALRQGAPNDFVLPLFRAAASNFLSRSAVREQLPVQSERIGGHAGEAVVLHDVLAAAPT